MASPTNSPLGRLAYAAFIFNSAGVYGTEQDCSGAAGHLVPAESFHIGNTKAESHFPHGANLKWEVVEVLTDVKGEFTMKMPMRYDGAGPALLAALIGTDTVTTVDITAKKHAYSWVHSNNNIGTVALWFAQTNGLVQVLRSCKLTHATLDVKSNAPASLTIKGMGDEVLQNSATNTTTTLATMTMTADAIKKAIMYWHATTRTGKNAGFVRIKSVTGSEGNTASTDTVFPSSWKMTIDKKMKQGDSPDQFGMEPVEDGVPQIKYELDIPGFEGRASDRQNVVSGIIGNLQNQQGTSALVYKCEFYFESPDLAGSTTQKYAMKSMSPECAIIVKNPGITGMGMAGAKLDIHAMQAQTAANGSDWTGLTDAFYMTFWNQRASAYI